MNFRMNVKCSNNEKTNFDNILSMNIDNMAKYLVEIGWSCTNCTEDKRLGDSNSPCDANCVLHCKEWLNKEVKSNG